MSTGKDFLNFILDQLSDLESVTWRSMMGEYIIYYRGKAAALLCDDRLLVKPVPSACRILSGAPLKPPYEGAKDMILVENLDSREFLAELFESMYDELPEPKKKK